ncbi:immunoglobulin-like domain-containing protein, partial [Erysipelothrix urinaevulpis]|uniref:immunoglobulin-like domain-containing protein n=1 Tax=Erysipelothrix urinaevulpis TaxID=2683717 RepID=UPI0039EFBB3F
VEVNDLAQVKSSGDYAKKVVGDYPIEIGIKGHEETAKIIGKVSKNPVVIIGDFIIEAENFNLNLKESALHDHAMYLERSNPIVMDRETFAVVDKKVAIGTDKVESVMNDKGYDVGLYIVDYQEDQELIVKATVSNLNKPVLNFESVTSLAINDAFDPMENVSASDIEDGDLSDQITITKNTVDTSKRGVYAVEYSVTDSDDNTVTGKRTV